MGSSLSSVASHGLFIRCLSLICFVRGSPHYLVSVLPCVALFIKRGESLFRELSDFVFLDQLSDFVNLSLSPVLLAGN
jgi:hypothetical protein